MNIQFLNHSCYILRTEKMELLVDPWLEGRVFLDGWDLIMPTPLDQIDFSKITHIWISHEHPDHFHIPTLKKISVADRQHITILIPKTNDRRMFSYLHSQGFINLIEMEAGKPYFAADGTELRCSLYAEIDSWLFVKSGKQTVLNTNDCGIRSKTKAESVRQMIGEDNVDVLLTQFSYAYWKGNPEEKSIRETEAQKKLGYLKLQSEVFRPKTIIPIASFIWFCHEENFYLNDSIVHPDEVESFIKSETAADCVVLAPGDKYEIGEQYNNTKSLAIYRESYQKAIRRDRCLMTKTVTEKDLQLSSLTFLKRLNRQVPNWLRFFLSPAKVFVTDLNKTYLLDPKIGLTESAFPTNEADVALSSESLNYCFAFSWGLDTLCINGRHTRPAGGDFSRFYKLFRFDLLEGRGFKVGPKYIVASIGRKVLTRLGLHTP